MSAGGARARGLHHLRIGRPQAAVDAFCESLGQDPDDADTHAWLALALLGAKRLGAARIEAELAVGMAAEAPLPLYVLGRVRLAERRYADAEAVFAQLLAVEPDDADNHRGLAEVYAARSEWDRALATLGHARALAPSNPDVLTDIAEVHLGRGDLAEAEAAAREALGEAPEHVDALVAMGWVLLRRGQAADAREHAVAVLRAAPMHVGATALLVGVKARESRILGLWWRYNTWMMGLGSGAIPVLLVGFAAYRLAAMLASDFGSPGLADLVQLVWLAFAAYTWFGPALFRRALDRELEPVVLKEGF